ncbi:hypothetical protein C8R47DRAFT_643391 [Mycena vitilis]|nr:hypothetical protein C8R47DRAFT_643391 [Mycena vitilis]
MALHVTFSCLPRKSWATFLFGAQLPRAVPTTLTDSDPITGLRFAQTLPSSLINLLFTDSATGSASTEPHSSNESSTLIPNSQAQPSVTLVRNVAPSRRRVCLVTQPSPDFVLQVFLDQ